MGVRTSAAVIACSTLAVAWTPLPNAQLSSFVFPGQPDAYGWRGSDAPTCENLSCDVRNLDKWTNGQEQLDAFAAKWGGRNQQAVAPDGLPMIATFGHCLVKTQRCGQCGMITFLEGQEYTLSTGPKFIARQSLNILVMCIDNAEAAATWSYETTANDYLAAIQAIGAHDLDTNAHPLVTDIAPADCLSGSTTPSTTIQVVPTTTVLTTTVVGACSGEPCDREDTCRSQWGFCGVTTDHCNDKSLWCGSSTTGCLCAGSSSTPVALTSTADAGTTTTTIASTTVGGGACMGIPCDTEMHCRSKWGWCGITTNHCNDEALWCGSEASGCKCGGSRRLRGGAGK